MQKDLIQRVFATITQYEMLRAGDRVGMGISGGSDSLALLRILNEVSERLGVRLSVLHFNHGMRGAESDEDESFVAKLAAELDLPFYSERGDVLRVARAKRWNLEDTARRLRYEFFSSLVSEGRVNRVAVAHTADDQAETVLARLVRGTGPAGLAAIYPVKGHVVRPLIEVRRADLRAYLNSVGQRWHEDRTNFDTTRLRARLRHRVLPLLEREIQPAIVNQLNRLASLAREDELFWRELIAARLRLLLNRQNGSTSIRCADLLTHEGLPSNSAFEHPHAGGAGRAVSRRLVRGIIEELRGNCRQWTAEHVERVIRLAAVGASGSRLELPGVIVERSFDWLWFSAANQRAKICAEISTPTKRSADGAFSQLVKLGNPGESTVVTVPEIGRRFDLKVVDWCASRSDTDSDKYSLDRDLLDTPLVLRSWRPGDSFQPSGRRSARKLKDYLRLERVRVSHRRYWPVLTSGNVVVWTPGLPVAEGFAPGLETRTGVVIKEAAV